MDFRRIVIPGGAGFVGSNLAVLLRQSFPDTQVCAVDNLKRRGSELNLTRLREHGVTFQHGDVRCREDVESWPAFDLLIDCSAEPSVQAGLDGSPLPVIQHNLLGTIQCLEAARRCGAAFLFLSTSRVYPVPRLNALHWQEDESRFRWPGGDEVPGFSAAGVAEEFPLDGPRSLYGATKLAAELLLQEYAWTFSMPALINRCGVLTGPWQMGKVDQGVITLWVARHVFGRPLRYTGFGGTGKQVRDLLHVEDLFDLITRQLRNPSCWDGRVYNVGGGVAVSTSLRELTSLCQEVTGRQVALEPQPETSPVDLRIYVTDHRRVSADFGWQPSRGVAAVVDDVHRWLRRHEAELATILA